MRRLVTLTDDLTEDYSGLAKIIAEDEQSLFFFRLGCVDTGSSNNIFKDKEKEIRYQKWKLDYGKHIAENHD
jgi:hypothetical protein